MSFFLQSSFGEKMAQKSFKILSRTRTAMPSESEIRCLLCADSSFMLAEIILCTDQAVFYSPRVSNGLNKYDFSSISAVTIETVNAYPSVCLTISNGETSKLYVATKEAEKMADYIKSKISRPASETVVSATSFVDELVKLKTLLDQGALTQEEFEHAKKKLLTI